MNVGGVVLVTNRTGEYFVSSSLHFSGGTVFTIGVVEQYVINPLVFGDIAFSHGYPNITKFGMLDALAFGSPTFTSAVSALPVSTAARCPPAENPMIPMRSGSMRYF